MNRLVILNSKFHRNSVSYGKGGAIFINYESTLYVEGAVFSNNVASKGGSIYTEFDCELSSIHIKNCVFQNDSAYNKGGAIYHRSYKLSIEHCKFIGCKARFGGAVYLGESYPAQIDNCSFVDNHASESGGAIFHDNLLVLKNSTFQNNGALTYGGACYSEWVLSTFQNCTLSGNSAGVSGGAIAGGPVVRILNTTITDNTADFAAGVMASRAILHSSIIAGNIARHSPDILTSADSLNLSLGFNLIGNAQGSNIAPWFGDIFGDSLSPIDPLLVPLADNGGPTLTHAPLPGSPALNAGSIFDTLSTDQRGFLRPFDNTRDIGAVELSVIAGEVPVFLNCPNDIVSCSHIVAWPPPTAYDNDLLTLTRNIQAGSPFLNTILIVTYTATDAAGNSSECCFTITINPLPNANAGRDTTIISGNSTILGSDQTGTGGTPPFTYQWYNLTGGPHPEAVANPVVSPPVTSEFVLFVIDSKGCAATDDAIVSVNATVVEDGGSKTEALNDLEKWILIYPNPSGGVVNIQHNLPDIGKLEILNVLGEVVFSEINFSQNQLDLKELPNGQYLVKVYSGKLMFTEQFILVK
jgi:predicted outer membrane repeat protein